MMAEHYRVILSARAGEWAPWHEWRSDEHLYSSWSEADAVGAQLVAALGGRNAAFEVERTTARLPEQAAPYYRRIGEPVPALTGR